LILLVVLIFIYHSTQSGLEEAAWDRLHEAADQLSVFARPGDELKGDARSCFIVRILPGGELMAIGGASYDLEDPNERMALLEKAAATNQEQGVLKEENLRFLRCNSLRRGKAYAFTDMDSEQLVLKRMHWTSLMILLAGMLIFFGFSVWLTRWTVRPVEQAWEQQRQFVADASHELKTPLTVILTNAELLHGEEYDAESKERFAASILTMSRQMRGLVEELLDQARVDSTQAEHRKLDYSRLVEDAVLPFEPLYFEAGRELRCQIEPGITAMGIAEHLRRVVEVLLDNGCKYSTANGVVELKLCRQGRGSLLSVHSPGVTMTEQECLDIFKRFYRMDQARTMNRSYGLGLSIAQGIVQQHKGKIWAQSQDGFNTFFVSLPQ
jgi:signal transduction histidine kinase